MLSAGEPGRSASRERSTPPRIGDRPSSRWHRARYELLGSERCQRRESPPWSARPRVGATAKLSASASTVDPSSASERIARSFPKRQPARRSLLPSKVKPSARALPMRRGRAHVPPNRAADRSSRSLDEAAERAAMTRSQAERDIGARTRRHTVDAAITAWAVCACQHQGLVVLVHRSQVGALSPGPPRDRRDPGGAKRGRRR